jgi:ABC-type siderophore export system fused ATPase/permease subunit
VETVVAALLLVVSATLLACVVVNYAVNIVEHTLQMTDIPQIDRIREIQDYLYNQTDSVLNQTMPEISGSLPP